MSIPRFGLFLTAGSIALLGLASYIRSGSTGDVAIFGIGFNVAGWTFYNSSRPRAAKGEQP